MYTKVRIKFNDEISEPIHIKKGVRQGCGLSPVLFTIYINKIIQEFKKKGIQLNDRKVVNTILYADDQILMATSEDELQVQTMAYHVNLIARKYKMTISSTKNKINGNVWKPHTEGKNCDKRQYYRTGNRFQIPGVPYIRI